MKEPDWHLDQRALNLTPQDRWWKRMGYRPNSNPFGASRPRRGVEQRSMILLFFTVSRDAYGSYSATMRARCCWRIGCWG